MARERESVEALRRRIVAAATRRFADAGYDATSIQQIARDVGIGKTLVLYHYPSKEALRTEVLIGVTAAWEAFLPRLVDGMERGAGVEQAIGPIVAFMRENPDLPRFVLREMIDTRGEVAAWMGERLGPTTAAAAQLVAGLQGGTDPGDAHAQVVLAALMLLTVLAVFKPGEDGVLRGPAPGQDDGVGERVLSAAMAAVATALAAR